MTSYARRGARVPRRSVGEQNETKTATLTSNKPLTLVPAPDRVPDETNPATINTPISQGPMGAHETGAPVPVDRHINLPLPTPMPMPMPLIISIQPATLAPPLQGHPTKMPTTEEQMQQWPQIPGVAPWTTIKPDGNPVDIPWGWNS